MQASYRFYATAPKGMGGLLAEELKALNAHKIVPGRAGVAFEDHLESAYRVCLWSRLANRVLMPITSFPAASPEALYEGIRTIDWSQHLGPSDTLAVDCKIEQSAITHSRYAALKIKDAIVDQFRDAGGVRPSVDLLQPSVRVNAYIKKDRVMVSLDLAGSSLHLRGYREERVFAPMKENLAAAVLAFSGWPEIAARGGPLADPLCGSGTLLIEAALMAADAAPGLLRPYYGFLGWRGHDPRLWERLLKEARERREAGIQRLPLIMGWDKDPAAVSVSLANAARAGFQGRIRVEACAIAHAMPSRDLPAGLFVTNPPYGERIGEETALIPLYGEIGHILKTRFGGWKAAVFTGNPRLGREIGIRPDRTHVFYNGPLRCELLTFEIPSGRRVRRIPGSGRLEPPRTEAPKPPAPEIGPGGEMLGNRLKKNLKVLSRWARSVGVDCFRVYDADLPEYNFAIDLYRGESLWAHVQEYEAPLTVSPRRAEERRAEALAVIPSVLDIPPDHLFFKVRQRQRGAGQYGKQDDLGRFTIVKEGPCRFWVNLTDYIDTGLFLDHRITRDLIRTMANGKRFLNLFGYTGTATVHALAGGARSTTTVDLSATYLDWARRNIELNGFDAAEQELIQADCLQWLAEASAESPPSRQYDLIFLDAPTFSNSKRMKESFDIQRDHPELLAQALELLAPEGDLIFSTNRRSFKLNEQLLSSCSIRDITRATLPKDFARHENIHHCWHLTKEPA
ncbi:Ribosomal RNA large subunit methyltransferase K/L (Includes: 23S rRNA m2G2445 methyltransferase; 23S rRNA m7G2069 methyltransferase) [uncultured Desulfatiglans sp.]|uniref:Ribosomal RNA large subunit methyltransferase K/L n=1 Tax=Uncultured Desulfatiglans sp. TaxID=1748965 RepID=A0A653AAT4_UNCDX|nr:Ribosomal RNA large subunit methyltransferase K/L (Includes: 23S rRNA m2G2445 methyltransferase; 23S rRNA m7G2069 methyltransferase) [uncultured Desulfatiglans sp.]